MKIIIHTKHYGNRDVLIDDEDYCLISKYTWYLLRNHNTFYAHTAGNSMIKMHRLILKICNSNIMVDHINGNGLDNRKANLRICTISENACNSKIRVNNHSGIKGVCWDKKTSKWRAHITLNYKKYWLGFFNNKNDARIARENAAILIHKDFARNE